VNADLVLLPMVAGREAYVRRVSDQLEVPGLLDPEERDDSVVLVEAVLGDRVKMRLGTVRRAVFEAVADEHPDKPVSWCRTLTEIHLRAALTHWQSPFGLDFKVPGPPESLLHYHGDWYARRKGGRLTWLQKDEFVPDFSEACRIAQFAEVILHSGLLGGGRR
jgi:hypothetical protein